MQRQSTDTYSWLLKLAPISITSISLVQAAVGREFTISDIWWEAYYPGTFFNRSKYLIDCLSNKFNLAESVSNICNITVLHETDITGKLVHPIYSCLFTNPENMQNTKTCFNEFVKSAQISARASVFNPAVVTMITIVTMMGLMFYLVKRYSRSVRVEVGNHLIYLVNAIRYGDEEGVSDYLRHHHNELNTADLRYALNIAEQTNHDECYMLVSSLLIEKLNDLPAPRVEVLKDDDEDDQEIETNEKKLINIGYDLAKIPAPFIDPVDQTIMDNPVTLSTQHNIDQRTLLKQKQFGLFRCPITNLQLPCKEFDYPINTGLKKIIDEYVENKFRKFKPQ